MNISSTSSSSISVASTSPSSSTNDTASLEKRKAQLEAQYNTDDRF